MTALKLSKEEKEKIVSASHHAPRSVLGFHEHTRTDRQPVWVIRVMEPDAEEVRMFWEDQHVSDAVALTSLANWMMFAALSPAAEVLRPE